MQSFSQPYSHNTPSTHSTQNKSLPKTQPSYTRTLAQTQPLHSLAQTCPDVSEFQARDRHEGEIYTHRMDIDYGRLSGFGGLRQGSEQVGRGVENEESGCKAKGYRNVSKIELVLGSKSKSMVKLSKSIPDSPINQLPPDNPHCSQPCSTRPPPPQPRLKLAPQSASSKKLKQVLAARRPLSNTQIIYQKLASIDSTAHKSSTRPLEQERLSRRTAHCRIVKTYVGGQGMQVKIISYPDSTQYMRLCGTK